MRLVRSLCWVQWITLKWKLQKRSSDKIVTNETIFFFVFFRMIDVQVIFYEQHTIVVVNLPKQRYLANCLFEIIENHHLIVSLLEKKIWARLSFTLMKMTYVIRVIEFTWQCAVIFVHRWQCSAMHVSIICNVLYQHCWTMNTDSEVRRLWFIIK